VTALGPPAVILDSHNRFLHSAAVGDDYLLDVWSPDSYEGSGLRYPVYMLDSPGFWTGRQHRHDHVRGPAARVDRGCDREAALENVG